MLQLAGVETAYGNSQVLFGIDLKIGEGEAVSLMGRNGMGKTTVIRSIMGLTPPRRGSIRFRGRNIRGLPAFLIARAGIGLVPEGRRIFPNLSVRENLLASARPGYWTLQRVYEMFPRLQEREGNMGNQLSGGEQQMLAIGRALMTNPRLLILDEATEGLAPTVRAVIWRCLHQLRELGQSLLIVDHHLESLLRICDRHYIIDKGHIVWSGDSAAFRADSERTLGYLTV
ncbi:MAG: ABC transporter ATP-binding protein [Xanthomonadaceae bacterium]|nr:ABC transporter ATP-binding protein [Xanthomonadaceae bacterium]